MKRTPLKRKAFLSRGPAPDAPYRDPDGKPLVRKAGLKRAVLKPGRRKTRVLVPQDVRRRAFGTTGGRCIRCGEQATQLHHVLPRRLYPDFEREGMNLAPCCHGCHDEHERAHRRFTQRELGPHLWGWAADRDRAYMQRTYPA